MTTHDDSTAQHHHMFIPAETGAQLAVYEPGDGWDLFPLLGWVYDTDYQTGDPLYLWTGRRPIATLATHDAVARVVRPGEAFDLEEWGTTQHAESERRTARRAAMQRGER